MNGVLWMSSFEGVTVFLSSLKHLWIYNFSYSLTVMLPSVLKKNTTTTEEKEQKSVTFSRENSCIELKDYDDQNYKGREANDAMQFWQLKGHCDTWDENFITLVLEE